MGQDQAVTAVSDAVLRSRAGLQDPSRPLGSFSVLGTNWRRKNRISQSISGRPFDSEQQMVRIDMSEYMEKESVSRLVGAAPGYVGYEEGGQLTEAVRRHPIPLSCLMKLKKHIQMFSTFCFKF